MGKEDKKYTREILGLASQGGMKNGCGKVYKGSSAHVQRSEFM